MIVECLTGIIDPCILLMGGRLSSDCRKKLENLQRALNNEEMTGEQGGGGASSSQAAALLDVFRALMLDHVKTLSSLEFGVQVENRWAQVGRYANKRHRGGGLRPYPRLVHIQVSPPSTTGPSCDDCPGCVPISRCSRKPQLHNGRYVTMQVLQGHQRISIY